jgi:hypothetical protein
MISSTSSGVAAGEEFDITFLVAAERNFLTANFNLRAWVTNPAGVCKDPWSARQFSDRQRTYASQWNSGNIYTPGFVLNGAEWRDWSALKDGPPARRKSTGVLTVNSTDTNRWAVTFAPTKAANGPYTIHAALLASGLISNVKAGENRGHRLEHDFVVLSLSQGALTDASGIAKGEFTLARPPGDASSQLALTACVTQAGQLEPIQATGGWLEAKTAASN